MKELLSGTAYCHSEDYIELKALKETFKLDFRRGIII